MKPSALVSGPLASVLCLWRGFTMLNAPGLRRYVWAPVLINLLLYGLGFWAASHYFAQVMSWLIPGWLDWLRWLLWPLFTLILLIVAFFTFTLLANVIGAPFYGLLAAKTHRLLTGQAPAGGTGPWAKELVASLASEGARVAYIATRLLPLLPLFLVPVANLLVSAIWLLFGAWSLALEYMAYPLELHGLSFAEQRASIRRRRLDALAFGGAVMLGLSMPLINIFIPPAAVIGATLYIAGREKGRVSSV
jgi:CysZ protein